MLTTSTGCSTSGIWLTRSLFRASRPRHISAMMMTIVATGRLMLKSERNMASGPRVGGSRVALGADELDLLPVDQRAAGLAQDLVAIGQAGLQRVFAAPHVALAELHRHLRQRLVLHAPDVGRTAAVHHRRFRQRERGTRAARLDAALGIEAGGARRGAVVGEGHQHLDLARGGI